MQLLLFGAKAIINVIGSSILNRKYGMNERKKNNGKLLSGGILQTIRIYEHIQKWKS